ncbi:MAG: ABC transporter ATP-binding protein [Haloarculaceae archaeon]
MTLLELDDVHTYYDESHVLHGIDMDVDSQEVVAVLGRNGAGKTTTLRSITGLTPPREGTVTLDGEDITGLSPYKIARRGIGFVPEERRLFNGLTVHENLRMAEIEDVGEYAIDDAYDIFPTLDSLRESEAGDLSGGEQQMLAIARGLLGGTKLLLLDEPTEGLAPQIVEDVMEAVRTLKDESVTIVLVEQNVQLALDVADRAYIVESGRIVHHAPAEELAGDEETVDRYLATGIES